MDKFRDANCDEHNDKDFFSEAEFRLKSFDCKECEIEILKNIRGEEEKLSRLGKFKSDYSKQSPGEESNSGFSS